MRNIDDLVKRFLAWQLPESVRADVCATIAYPHPRSGTNLLSAAEARQMILHLLSGDAEPDRVLGSRPVTQQWVWGLTFMQQSVLLAAIRGPDGIDKNHVAKKLLRWLRRCTLYSAFDRKVLARPHDEGGGSFTGPSVDEISLGVHGFVYLGPGRAVSHTTWQLAMHEVLDDYLRATDAIPHHFQLHFLHAAEVLGYKHPEAETRDWWHDAYCRLVNDMHLFPESEETMDRRLGDNEPDWREAEEVRAD